MILNSVGIGHPSFNKKANVYKTNKFTYNPIDKSFTAEASSLCRGNVLCRIFNDACDYGFWMESERTGKLMLFTLASTDKSPDSEEIYGYRLTSAEGFSVLIIND